MLFHKYFAAFSFVALGLNLAPDNSVTITIENIKNTNGTIQIAIFDKSESFPKPGGEFKVAKYKIVAGQSQFKIKDIPNGEYAIAIHHDENSDGKMNTNLIGIPKEGYAFSKNFKPKFSAPKFSDCAIQINNDQKMTVKMIY